MVGRPSKGEGTFAVIEFRVVYEHVMAEQIHLYYISFKSIIHQILSRALLLVFLRFQFCNFFSHSPELIILHLDVFLQLDQLVLCCQLSSHCKRVSFGDLSTTISIDIEPLQIINLICLNDSFNETIVSYSQFELSLKSLFVIDKVPVCFRCEEFQTLSLSHGFVEFKD